MINIDVINPWVDAAAYDPAPVSGERSHFYEMRVPGEFAPGSATIGITFSPSEGWPLTKSVFGEVIQRKAEDWGLHSASFLLDFSPPFSGAPAVTFVGMQPQTLSDRVRMILDWLIPQLSEFALRCYIPVQRVEISEFIDPEEDDRHITITQWVHVSADTALKYWDELALVVEDFVEQLPSGLSSIAKRQIQVEVFWNDEQPTLFTSPL